MEYITQIKIRNTIQHTCVLAKKTHEFFSTKTRGERTRQRSTSSVLSYDERPMTRHQQYQQRSTSTGQGTTTRRPDFFSEQVDGIAARWQVLLELVVKLQ